MRALWEIELKKRPWTTKRRDEDDWDDEEWDDEDWDEDEDE
jgi:hypothetical protein